MQRHGYASSCTALSPRERSDNDTFHFCRAGVFKTPAACSLLRRWWNPHPHLLCQRAQIHQLVAQIVERAADSGRPEAVGKSADIDRILGSLNHFDQGPKHGQDIGLNRDPATILDEARAFFGYS